MLILRKIDFYLQTIIGVLMIVSIPWLFFYGFLAGLFILGCWQLISATLNTSSFLAHSKKKQITNYWKFTSIDLSLLLLCFLLALLFDSDDVQIIGAVAVFGAIPIAAYYFAIYDRLITDISLTKELSGLTKSKH